MNKYFAKNIIIWLGVFLGLGLMYKFVDRDSLSSVIYQSLPPKEAGLLAGIILGDKTGFDKNFSDQLKNSGVMHMVVVSGSNVMLLSSIMIENLAKLLGRKRAIVLGLAGTFGYVGMVGWEAPVIRAVILLTIFYWAQILGRRYSISRGLVLTVVIMMMADYKIISSVSFWLSLLAFLAIITQRNKEKGISGVVGSTLWVGLWLTPVLGLMFGRISLISFLTNTLVVGIVEIVTLVGGIGMIAGIFWGVLGKTILLLVYPLLKYFVMMVEIMGNLWWASVEIKFNLAMFLGWYLILGSFLLRRKYEV